jgi:hypothetical protein
VAAAVAAILAAKAAVGVDSALLSAACLARPADVDRCTVEAATEEAAVRAAAAARFMRRCASDCDTRSTPSVVVVWVAVVVLLLLSPRFVRAGFAGCCCCCSSAHVFIMITVQCTDETVAGKMCLVSNLARFDSYDKTISYKYVKQHILNRLDMQTGLQRGCIITVLSWLALKLRREPSFLRLSSAGPRARPELSYTLLPRIHKLPFPAAPRQSDH